MSKYIGYTGNPWKVKTGKSTDIIYCNSPKELEIKSAIYLDYQNTCRYYADERE